MELERVQALLRALGEHKVAYKIVGGVALNFQGVVRATEDLDLFVAPDAENIARLKAAFRSVYADPCIDEISAADLLGEYPAVQYVPPDGLMPIDVMTRLAEAFDYASIEAESKALGDLVVVVATPRMLIRMKRDTVRLQDKADAQRLREVHAIEDE